MPLEKQPINCGGAMGWQGWLFFAAVMAASAVFGIVAAGVQDDDGEAAVVTRWADR